MTDAAWINAAITAARPQAVGALLRAHEGGHGGPQRVVQIQSDGAYARQRVPWGVVSFAV